MRRLLLFAVLFILAAVLAGCGGISDGMRQTAEGVPARIKSVESDVAARELRFKRAQDSADFAFHSPYAKRENWSASFADAHKSIAAAETVQQEIGAILKRNDEQEEPQLQTQLNALEGHLTSAADASRRPAERMEFLLMVKEKAPSLVALAERELAHETTVFQRLDSAVKTAASKYPGKKDDLLKRDLTLRQSHDASLAALASARRELKSASPDYAVIGDGYTLVRNKGKWMQDQDKLIKGRIGELGRSYSKTLADMKQDQYVTITRTSWDEYSDWNTETDYSYNPVKVDAEVYDYFEAWPDDQKLASYSSGYFSNGLSTDADQSMWNKLGIDSQEGWSDGSQDSAEYYVEDLPVKSYHKYAIIENGKTSTTDWTPVSDAFFEEHVDDLGMDIVSKPYGMYEDEVIKTAAPPGMAYVGNPAYGRWQGGPGGGSFWVWYGQYRLMESLLGGRRYYYGDWNDWNRNYRGRRPYYGRRGKDEEQWGTGSGYARTRYAGSTWSRTGGFRDDDASVRGAGASARGGGPGGGGK